MERPPGSQWRPSLRPASAGDGAGGRDSVRASDVGSDRDDPPSPPPPPDPGLWLRVAHHAADRVWARSGGHLAAAGVPPLESPDAGGPEGRPLAPESPDAGGQERGAEAAAPSLGHALRFAWAVVWLSSSEEGRQSLRGLLRQLEVPVEAASAWERRLQWRDAHQGGTLRSPLAHGCSRRLPWTSRSSLPPPRKFCAFPAPTSSWEAIFLDAPSAPWRGEEPSPI
eukprot:15456656-Alexandrium_andersonii.AAC.1